MTVRSSSATWRGARPHSARRPPRQVHHRERASTVLTRRTLIKSAIVGAAGAALPIGLYRPASTPAAVPGYALPLPLLPKARPVGKNSYMITARPGTEVMHPADGRTNVWGYYDNSGRGVTSPGYTIEAQKGTAT